MSEADTLLRDPFLLSKIDEAIHQSIVGETINSLSIFFEMLSTKTDDPGNLGLSGLSSSGKTAMTRAVLKLFPREMLIVRTGMTKKAFYYELGEVSEDDPYTRVVVLKGKIVVFLEESGCQEVLDEMKPLLSHDLEELEYVFVQRRGSANITHKTRLKGWPSYIGLTTSSGGSAEQQTRKLSSSPDLNKEKFGAVLDSNTKKYVEPWSHIENVDNYRVIQEAIRKLRQVNIWIPQLPLIRKRFPDNEPRCMRDFNGFISVLKTVVTLHQYQRPTFKANGLTYTACAPVDVLIAVHVLKNAIADTLSGLPKDVREYFNHIKDLGLDFENKDLLSSYKDFSGIDIARSTFNERFRDKLIDAGLLEVDKAERTHKYSVVHKELSSLSEPLKQWEIFFSKDLKDYSLSKLVSTGVGELEAQKIVEDIYAPLSVDKLLKVLTRPISEEYPKINWQFDSDITDTPDLTMEEKSDASGVKVEVVK
jgi:hypothetical protein